MRDAGRVGGMAATLAVALVPLWWHVDLVPSDRDGIIAVFSSVSLYPTDVCLAVLAAIGGLRPARLDAEQRLMALGLGVLAAASLASASWSARPLLAGGTAWQVALLGLAFLGLRSARVSRSSLISALAWSAAFESVLAIAQVVFQHSIIPDMLHLPWLPSDPRQPGAPVVLGADGERLLRGFGTFPHPNVLGAYLALALVCLPVLGPTRAWTFGTIVGAGLIATFSRAAWLGALLGLGTWWLASEVRGTRRWRPVLATGIVVTGVLLSPIAPTVSSRLWPLADAANPLERGSVENRLALDRDSLLIIARKLPLGVGAANYGATAVREGYQEGWGEPVPNVALLVVAELGLSGLVGLGLLALGAFSAARRADAAGQAAVLVTLSATLLDHYMWTMPLGRVIGWAVLAVLASREPRRTRRGWHEWVSAQSEGTPTTPARLPAPGPSS